MCLIPYLKVYHGSKKCLGSFFSNGLLCWEMGNALNPLRVNLFLMLVFIGPKSLPFNAFSLKSLQISLVWFSRNWLKMANPFCLLVKRPSAVMSEEKRLPFAGWEEERPEGEDKKTMVVLLVFIYDYFGGSFWSEKKTVGSKRLIWRTFWAGCCSRERALSTNSKTSLPLVSHDLPLKRLANS